MNTKININYEGTDYVLEYNRESIEVMERRGFIVSELDQKPMLMLPMAFQGLFYKNHKNIKNSTIDDIYNKLKDKQKLLETIGNMLSEAYNTLLETTEDDKGNLDWEIVG